MAKIIVATYMVRYPMGGMLSWALQWPLGFHRLGHDVFVVEKATYDSACFDPVQGIASNDCSYGLSVVNALLERFGLGGKLIFVDSSGVFYGANFPELETLFSSADLLIDIGNHGAWQAEAAAAQIPTALVDGEPGFTQIKMENAASEESERPSFDYYYSNGANIGTEQSSAPTAGKQWQHVFNPVVTDIFPIRPAPPQAPFTTVMNWQSHDPIHYNGRIYGQKDVEFARFLDLPARVETKLEVAAAGKVPRDDLLDAGWQLQDAHSVTSSFDTYADYIGASAGEFSVCKNVFVATRSGWFSDRSAAYLSTGRPVVLQDTGFSTHLPCGRGLYAVNSVEEAAVAIEEISGDYPHHSRWAAELAREYLDSSIVLGNFLHELGV
ncbi:MAG: hypothetical protein ACR2PS_02820 [Pseudomonadales bacterium]